METATLLIYVLCSLFQFLTEGTPTLSLQNTQSDNFSKQDEGDASDLGLLMVMIRHVEGRMKNLEKFVEKSINDQSMF